MYNSQSNRMTDHPLKVFFATMAGLAVGSHSLLNAHPWMSVTAISWQATLDLAIACGKAFVVGGAAYFGQTIAGHYRKKAANWWKNKKFK